MRLPKATLRRSGHKMMSAKVAHNIGADEVTNGIADHCLSDMERLPNLTKTEAWKATLSLLHSKGSWWFPEGMDWEENKGAIMAKARELFPELFEAIPE